MPSRHKGEIEPEQVIKREQLASAAELAGKTRRSQEELIAMVGKHGTYAVLGLRADLDMPPADSELVVEEQASYGHDRSEPAHVSRWAS